MRKISLDEGEQILGEYGLDIMKSGRFGSPTVIVTNKRILIEEEGNPREYRLNEIKSVRVVQGFGVSSVVARVDGGDVELFKFSNRVRDKVGELYNLLESLINGGSRVTWISHQASREVGRLSTAAWLIQLISPYKFKIALGVVLSLAVVLASLVPPYMLKIFINDVLIPRNPSAIGTIILALILAYGASVSLSVAQNYILNYIGQKLTNDLRVRIYEHVMEKLSIGFIESFQSGRILSRITSDVGNTQWFLVWGIPTLLTNTVLIIGIGVIMFSMNQELGALALIPVPAMVVGTIVYRKRSRLKYHKAWRRSADITSLLTDTIPSALLVKSYAKEETEVERLRSLTDELFDAQMKVVKTNLSWWPLLGFVLSSTTVLIWFMGGEHVLSGSMELGTLVAFVTYLSMFYQPIQNLTNVIPFMQQSFTSAERILEIVKARPEILTSPSASKPSLRGEISVEDVWFGYHPLIPVIRGASLKIRAGECVAIVGQNGSGKTTLIKLLLRFYDPWRGRILIDGIDLRDIDLNFYRANVGVVHSDPIILYGTVAYNIAYGKPDAKPEEIIAAAIMSRAHEFVSQLPFAYDTHLGERGNRLSSGQRQMIALARALVKDPKILIMDEPTANIDSVTESEILKSLSEIVRGRTTIIVSHRFSLLKMANRIIVIDSGKIVEEGSLEELIARKGKFYQMLVAQMGRAEIRDVEESPRQNVRGGSTLQDYVKMLNIVNAGEIRILDIDPVDGVVKASIRGTTYDGLKPFRPFPITAPWFIMLIDREGKPAATIRNINELPHEERIKLDKILLTLYFIPKVKKILSLDTSGDEFKWVLETDRGVVDIRTRGRHSLMRVGSRVVIIDSSDMIYEIEDLNALDKKSKALIEEII